MTPKEIAKAIDGLTKEEAIELANELINVYGYQQPEQIIVEKSNEPTINEEKSTFTVKLTSVGPQKLSLVRLCKEINGISLIDAKTMIESAPVNLKENISKEEAESVKLRFEEFGAEIAIL